MLSKAFVAPGLSSSQDEPVAVFVAKRLQAGTSEIRNWLVVAGAVAGTGMKITWADYIPGYRTPALTGTGLGFVRWA